MTDKYPGTTHFEGCWQDAHPAHRVCIEQHVDDLERQLTEAGASILNALGAYSDEDVTLAEGLRYIRDQKKIRDDWEEHATNRVKTLQEQLSEAQRKAEWVKIDEDHLPPEGYEVYGFVQGVEAVIHKFERPFNKLGAPTQKKSGKSK